MTQQEQHQGCRVRIKSIAPGFALLPKSIEQDARAARVRLAQQTVELRQLYERFSGAREDARMTERERIALRAAKEKLALFAELFAAAADAVAEADAFPELGRKMRELSSKAQHALEQMPARVSRKKRA